MPATLKRIANWPKALHHAVAYARRTRFSWGKHDCALFVADCVKAMTGSDLAIEVRGRYHDEAGSVTAMQRYWGVSTLEDAVTHLLGAPISAKVAKRGDVVLLNVTTGPALGICVGAHAVGAGPTGTVTVPMSQWVKAWRV